MALTTPDWRLCRTVIFTVTFLTYIKCFYFCIISKEDYKELHDGYTEKRKKAEEAVRSIDQQISEVLESKSDKYHWLDYFAEHQNIQELTRTVAVELIDQILVYDKKHIEVRFNFDDCYQSLLRQIQSVGCDVSTGMDGRIEIQKREVV